MTVLAEPNLTALSGEPASFLAGGEFPVPVPAGTGLVGIDFKNFGVSLNFIATVASGDRISLHVEPEVSELSTAGAIMISGTQVPALTTRRAETTVELASGQSFAIGGLLQNNVTQNINKFPWLGDVPVLGQLFRSEAFQRQETELGHHRHALPRPPDRHGEPGNVAHRRVRALDRWPARAACARVPVAWAGRAGAQQRQLEPHRPRWIRSRVRTRWL